MFYLTRPLLLQERSRGGVFKAAERAYETNRKGCADVAEGAGKIGLVGIIRHPTLIVVTDNAGMEAFCQRFEPTPRLREHDVELVGDINTLGAGREEAEAVVGDDEVETLRSEKAAEGAVVTDRPTDYLRESQEHRSDLSVGARVAQVERRKRKDRQMGKMVLQ